MYYHKIGGAVTKTTPYFPIPKQKKWLKFRPLNTTTKKKKPYKVKLHPKYNYNIYYNVPRRRPKVPLRPDWVFCKEHTRNVSTTRRGSH